MRKITAVILSVIIAAFLIPPMEANAFQPISVLKIGLAYGDNAVPAAKLQNVSGEQVGYQIGFYDTNRTFYPLITTYESQIVVLKDKPIWLTSEDEYLDVKPSSHKYYIGAYHAQVDATFATYQDAMSLAAVFTQLGYQAFPAFINGSFKLRVGEH
ncbi:MAG: hypothetical protein J6V15_04335, partial [Clostridia bacterium]|nr:hypothetical protein [Clostridia bacterium]